MAVTDLLIGATEDRVVGTLDMEKAIREGARVLEPGILVQASQNVLYVDEINLLSDHIADVILLRCRFRLERSRTRARHLCTASLLFHPRRYDEPRVR